MEHPVVMPEVYDGSSEWRTYQLYFMQCAELNAWTPARMAQILGVRLRGAARLFHAELEDDIRTNWEELTVAMALRFDQPQRSNLHKTAFRSRKKKNGGNTTGPC